MIESKKLFAKERVCLASLVPDDQETRICFGFYSIQLSDSFGISYRWLWWHLQITKRYKN